MKSTYLLCLFEFGCVESSRKVETGINFLKGVTASQTPRSASVRGRPLQGKRKVVFRSIWRVRASAKPPSAG